MKDKTKPQWWRHCVGGMWDEIGKFQFERMKEAGLRPHHIFADIGCGCFRGGRHFISYLNSGNYIGIDVDEEVITMGKEHELCRAHFDKNPRIAVNANFDFGLVLDKNKCERIDYALAQSVFTHLPKEALAECLKMLGFWLHDQGHFIMTIFESPEECVWPTKEPFKYSINMIRHIAGDEWCVVPLKWHHERRQVWLMLTKKGK